MELKRIGKELDISNRDKLEEISRKRAVAGRKGGMKRALLAEKAEDGTFLPDKTKQNQANIQAKEFIKKYCELHKARYKTSVSPPIDGRSVGIALQLIKTAGFSKAVDLLQAYLQLNDPWFVKQCHPLWILAKDLNRIWVALDRGIESPDNEDGWDRFWKNIDQEGKSETGNLELARGQNESNVGEASVPRRKDAPLLADF